MKCPECKFQNPDEMQFCGKCGSKLGNPCPECGFENPDDFSFCGKCGYDLSNDQDASSEIDYKEPQSYTPRHLADKILTSRSSIEGERKFVTVLFADVANFTSISERLDPEEIHQIMDGCFKILMDEIHKYEGTINQFTGDGVMALFGAPVACEDHAQRACYAAINIQKSLSKYSNNIELKYSTKFKMRIGINSGLVVVGSIGDDLRMDYTADGDTTNLAARMESLAKPGNILIAENTQKIIKDFFELKSIGKVKVKGKTNLQKAFQLLKIGDVETRIGASVAKGLTRFVGRKNSMNTLIEAFKKAKSGSGQIVGIVGEAGVGKSRLLLEMRNMFAQDESEYLEGRCLQYGNSIIYLPFLDILRSIFNIKDDDRENIVKSKIVDAIAKLNEQSVSFNSSFQDILSLKVDDEDYLKIEPKDKREKIFEAIRDLLIRMSKEKSLVIAIEDLHWIDKTSEQFLNYFIDWLANTNILLILLYRPEYIHQWGSKSFYKKIGIDQLGMSSSGDLVKAILEEGDVAPELRQLILNRSVGNPLFMEEFTHTLVENGSIEKRDNQYALKGNSEDIKVPDTIQGIIASRLDRLEDNLKRTMQVASVIGRDFAFKILQTISGMKNELKSNLLNLQGLEFIYEKSLFPELEYIFKHALTQEVAYNSLLQKRRKDIHMKIGDAIETLYPERLEEFYGTLAYHFEQAKVPEKTLTYVRLAGNRAIQLSADTEAINYFKRGLALIKTLPNTPENIQQELKLQLALSGPLIATKGHGALETVQTLYRARQLAEQAGDTSQIFPLLYGKWVTHLMRAEHKDTVLESQQFLSLAKQQSDKNMIMLGARLMGASLVVTGQIHSAQNYLKQALALYDPPAHEQLSFNYGQNPKTTSQLLMGWCLWSLGYPQKALDQLNQASTYAKQLNHTATTVQISAYSMPVYISIGDVIRADECGKALMAFAKKNESPYWLLIANYIEGWVLLKTGKAAAGISRLRKTIADLQSNSIGYLLTLFWSSLTEGYIAQGQLQEGLDVINEALAFVDETDERYWEAELHRLNGELLLMQGAGEEAENSFKQAITISRRQESKSLELRATISLTRLWQTQGKKEEAKYMLSEIYNWFTEGYNTADLRETKSLLDELV